MTKPTIVSIYSGLGGIDIGFEKAGFKSVHTSDIWQLSCDSLASNIKDVDVVCEDIEKIDFKSIKKKHKKIHGLVGGPPCPPFSKSRFYIKEKKRGIEDLDGFKTLTEYFRALEELSPDFFFFENVHGFVFKPHQSSFDLLKSESDRLGYKIFFDVVNAADYGIPQTRQRFICIGIKKKMKDFIYPRKTHSDPKNHKANTKDWVTCGDILNDIDFDLPEDKKMQAGSKHKDLLKQVPPGDNYLFFTSKRGHPKPQFKWRSRYWSFLLKLSPKRPSWTIQASHSNNMGPFHWKNRFLRISEIKRIQTFDDKVVIHGSYKDQWRQVGNAVPPKLSYIFAKDLYQYYYDK